MHCYPPGRAMMQEPRRCASRSSSTARSGTASKIFPAKLKRPLLAGVSLSTGQQRSLGSPDPVWVIELDNAAPRGGRTRKEPPMFIGVGTIVIIVIIVLAVMFLRRH